MDEIKSILEIDLNQFIFTVFVILLGLRVMVEVIKWFLFDLLGIETKSMRLKKEEHELLIQTSNDLKILAEKHAEDVKQSIEHDKRIQNNLDACMIEIKNSLSETQETIKQFTENRIHDRQQSFEIQKELTDSISKIVEGNETRDEQIQNIVV